MKKVISIFMSAVILVTSVVGMSFSAQAAASLPNQIDSMAENIQLNSSKTDYVNDYYDTRYYCVTATSDGKLDISFGHKYIDSYSYWTVTVFGPDKYKVFSKTIGTDERFETKDGSYYFSTIGVNKNDIYYIVVEGDTYYQDEYNEPYTVKVDFEKTNGEWETEYNNSFETADKLSLNSSISGNGIETNLMDYFCVTVPSTGSLKIKFAHEYVDSYGYWNVKIYNENKEKIYEQRVGTDESGNISFDISASKKSKYYIQVETYYYYEEIFGVEYNISNLFIPTTYVTLSTTSYTYNGNAKKPSVTVKDSNGKTLKKDTDYTVTYDSGRKNVGKYAVKVKFKGNYSGTKTLYFTIKPKSTSISSLTAKSKGFTVKWKKQSTQTSGYQIQYSTSSKFTNAKTVTVSGTSTTSKSISKLSKKKKYYVRVRTYKTVNGTKYYSSWSSSKSVKTK